MQLDKNTARLAKFIFKIGNNTFIRSVDLDRLLKQFVFYIVFINIPFFPCLTNINKYRAFLKNIINQVI